MRAYKYLIEKMTDKQREEMNKDLNKVLIVTVPVALLILAIALFLEH